MCTQIVNGSVVGQAASCFACRETPVTKLQSYTKLESLQYKRRLSCEAKGLKVSSRIRGNLHSLFNLHLEYCITKCTVVSYLFLISGFWK